MIMPYSILPQGKHRLQGAETSSHRCVAQLVKQPGWNGDASGVAVPFPRIIRHLVALSPRP